PGRAGHLTGELVGFGRRVGRTEVGRRLGALRADGQGGEERCREREPWVHARACAPAARSGHRVADLIRATYPPSGRTARTSVPTPRGLSTLSVPSAAPTRSTRPVRPEPASRRAPPTPSSRTSTTRLPFSAPRVTWAWLAWAYLATLVSASE